MNHNQILISSVLDVIADSNNVGEAKRKIVALGVPFSAEPKQTYFSSHGADYWNDEESYYNERDIKQGEADVLKRISEKLKAGSKVSCTSLKTLIQKYYPILNVNPALEELAKRSEHVIVDDRPSDAWSVEEAAQWAVFELEIGGRSSAYERVIGIIRGIDPATISMQISRILDTVSRVRSQRSTGLDFEIALIDSEALPTLLIRFVEELNIRFSKHLGTRRSDWQLDEDRVVERVFRALCLEHRQKMTRQDVKDKAHAVVMRGGNVAMTKPGAPSRGGVCIECLYPDVGKVVQRPLIYINAITYEDNRSDFKPVDLEGNFKSDIDWCDRWSGPLLGMLFGSDWHEMETAVYSNSAPRFYNEKVLRELIKSLNSEGDELIDNEASPWSVFELCTAYGLDVNYHLNKFVLAAQKRSLNEKENLQRLDRVLGGLASCFDRGSLEILTKSYVVSIKNSLFGCLMLKPARRGYLATVTDYINFRWNLFLRRKPMGNVFDMQDILDESGYIYQRNNDGYVTFKLGPLTLDGYLVDKGDGVTHFSENPGRVPSNVGLIEGNKKNL